MAKTTLALSNVALQCLFLGPCTQYGGYAGGNRSINRENGPFGLFTSRVVVKSVLSTVAFCVLATAASCSIAADAGDAAKEAGAVVSPSGLVYRSLKDGTGASPAASDTVKVHYRGTFLDGREFDSSYKRGEPIEFPLSGVIKCWTEGVQRMKVGGKAKLTCPAGIAYGERGAGGVIPANTTLQFEVELLGIHGK
jgi:FKBP-type peptidyl-prolyl cis-trans isomerase FkpA